LGPVLRDLLQNLPAQDPELALFKDGLLDTMAPAGNQSYAALRSNGSQPVIEPLTERELDVLSLLAQRQTDKEIALKLHISPHTVRSHTKNIYTKLDVNNRRQAVERALEVGLVKSD
jgi:LuxR family maltose regulon positive regulatory protein